MKYLALAIIAAIATAGAVYRMSSQKAGALPNPIATAWTQWKMQEGRSYGTDTEEEVRYGIFSSNYKAVLLFNQAGKSSKVALNKFADMTQEEVSRQYTGYVNLQKKLAHKSKIATKPHVKGSWNGESKDWRGVAVGDVKDQGQCGSCWAFSTTGGVEGADAIANGSIRSFSEQQLVDCDTEEDSGCNGVLMDYAFEYISNGHPLMLESDYAYTARQGSCKYDSSKGVGTVSGFTDVETNSDALKAALDKQPVSVAIEADQLAFQLYKSGVVSSLDCGSQLDHGVLAVGYGTLDGEDFFLVKNSWGSSWGDNGYVRIAPDACGIVNSASYPHA